MENQGVNMPCIEYHPTTSTYKPITHKPITHKSITHLQSKNYHRTSKSDSTLNTERLQEIFSDISHQITTSETKPSKLIHSYALAIKTLY